MVNITLCVIKIFNIATVRLSIILIANKVTNTTGNENSGPFIQPLV